MTLPSTIPVTELLHVTEREAEAIWLEAKSQHIRVFIQTLWYTGLRLCEVLRLRAKDISRKGSAFNLIVVRAKKRKPKAESLPISRLLGFALLDYIQARNLMPNKQLFPSHENTYRYQLRECACRAGLENWQSIHPHMFRHGFVYHQVRVRKLHPFIISKLMGHSSINNTLIYYHPTQEDLRDAMSL